MNKCPNAFQDQLLGECQIGKGCFELRKQGENMPRLKKGDILNSNCICALQMDSQIKITRKSEFYCLWVVSEPN